MRVDIRDACGYAEEIKGRANKARKARRGESAGGSVSRSPSLLLKKGKK